MNNLIYQTYIIALPIILTALLGYIVWLLQEQKKQKAIDTKERNERIEEEKSYDKRTEKVQCYFYEYSLSNTMISI